MELGRLRSFSLHTETAETTHTKMYTTYTCPISSSYFASCAGRENGKNREQSNGIMRGAHGSCQFRHFRLQFSVFPLELLILSPENLRIDRLRQTTVQLLLQEPDQQTTSQDQTLPNITNSNHSLVKNKMRIH